ncbi:hypothetical protein [Methanimicrococcus blatticola]|nr:hypothetical protein [Methanimicrococcus blatticola]MBZ3935869.1 hypothetical protein [Methanimicrococcus blatticola]MCC2508010.1 hypothetical protein [Methanimicrococcus blatticola]
MMKEIFNKSLNKIYQSINSLFLVIGLLTFIVFSFYYAKTENPSIQLLFQLFVLLIVWFIVYSMSSYYLYYHFENFKINKKSIVTGIVVFIFMIFFCLLILLLGSVINDSTLLPSEKIANIFNYIILISNIVLVIFTGTNLFLTNQKSQKESKEKNIRSDIEFYEKQLDKYYIPLSEKFLEISEHLVDYTTHYENLDTINFKKFSKSGNKETRNFIKRAYNIRKCIDDSANIINKYSYLNTDEINSVIFKDSVIINDLCFFNDFLNKYKSIFISDLGDIFNSNIEFKDIAHDERQINTEEIVFSTQNNNNFNILIRKYLSILQIWLNVELVVINRLFKGKATALDLEYINDRNRIILELLIKKQQISSDKINIATNEINKKIDEKYVELKRIES